MKKILMASLVIVVVGVVGFAAKGKIAPLSWGLWGDVNLESGVASGGYDVVSYHTGGTPLVGRKKFSSDFRGANWYFATLENKETFDANPESYVPRYGGFCAFAVYNNLTADVNPTIWHVENEKLYLFAGDGPKQDWIAEIQQSAIETTDSNWAQRLGR